MLYECIQVHVLISDGYILSHTVCRDLFLFYHAWFIIELYGK